LEQRPPVGVAGVREAGGRESGGSDLLDQRGGSGVWFENPSVMDLGDFLGGPDTVEDSAQLTKEVVAFHAAGLISGDQFGPPDLVIRPRVMLALRNAGGAASFRPRPTDTDEYATEIEADQHGSSLS
jgi:hypothetical protein